MLNIYILLSIIIGAWVVGCESQTEPVSEPKTLGSFFKEEKRPICDQGYMPKGLRHFLSTVERHLANVKNEPPSSDLDRWDCSRSYSKTRPLGDLRCEIRKNFLLAQDNDDFHKRNQVANYGRVLGWLSYHFKDNERGIYRSITDISKYSMKLYSAKDERVRQLLSGKISESNKIGQDLYVFGEYFNSIFCSDDTRREFEDKLRKFQVKDEEGDSVLDPKVLLSSFEDIFGRVLGPDVREGKDINYSVSDLCKDVVTLAGYSERQECDGVVQFDIRKLITKTVAKEQSNTKPTGLSLLEKKQPLVIWSNGMGGPSFVYEGLRRKIAAAGYEVVVGDDPVGIADFMGNKMIEAWNVHGRGRDTVGFIGHSKGGASSVNAARRIKANKRAVVSLMGAVILAPIPDPSVPFFGITANQGHWTEIVEGQEQLYRKVNGPAAHYRMDTTHSGAAVSLLCEWANPKQCTAVREHAIAWLDCHLKGKNCEKFGGSCPKEFTECKTKNIVGGSNKNGVRATQSGERSSVIGRILSGLTTGQSVTGDNQGVSDVSSILNRFLGGSD